MVLVGRRKPVSAMARGVGRPGQLHLAIEHLEEIDLVPTGSEPFGLPAMVLTARPNGI